MFGKSDIKEVNLYEKMVADFFQLNKEVQDTENRYESLEGTNFTDAVILDLTAKRAMRSALLNQIREYKPTEEEKNAVTQKVYAQCIEVVNN
jgi:hypothetical protein